MPTETLARPMRPAIGERDVGIAELQLRPFPASAFCASNAPRASPCLAIASSSLRLRRDVALHQFGLALDLDVGELERGFRRQDGCLRLVDRGLIEPFLDHEQQLAAP